MSNEQNAMSKMQLATVVNNEQISFHFVAHCPLHIETKNTINYIFTVFLTIVTVFTK